MIAGVPALRIVRRAAVSVALWIAVPLAALAADVRVYVEPDRGITDVDPVSLVIQVEGATAGTPSVPRLPEMKNLRRIGGPSTSMRHSWINGRSSVSHRLTYTLLAEGPGLAEIPEFEIRVGDETVRSTPIRFQVARAPERPRTPAQDPRGRRSRVEAFLEARLGSEEVWVGQPVALTVTLLTRGSVVGFAWHETPEFSSFWVEEDDVVPDAERRRVRREGREYVAIPLVRQVLVPSRAGEITIEPYVGAVEVSVSGGGFFSFGRTEQAICKSRPLTLRVRELPEAGRPADFDGAVGSFRLGMELDRTEAAVDEAVALTLTIAGNGFLKPVRSPELQAPADLKVFPPRPSEKHSVAGGRMVSSKTWEWVLVPLAPGPLELPQVRFSYFDPAAGEYRTERGGPLTIAVAAGDGREPGPPATAGGIRPRRRDIAFIKALSGDLATGAPRTHQRGWFLVLALLPIGLAPVLVLVGRRHARLHADRGRVRGRRARTRARRRLSAVRRRAAALDAPTFHEEVARALVEYVADRFDLASAGLTYDRIDERLTAAGIDPDLREAYRGCLERCDFARFVPASGRPGRRDETLEEAGELVERLERAL